MEEVLTQISICVQRGKMHQQSTFPKDMAGKDGVVELVTKALEQGIPAQSILSQGLIAGMEKVGELFRLNKIFIPEVMIAAKAMQSGMDLIKTGLEKHAVVFKGNIIIATVFGDLHDIGKNILGMFIKGAGWHVIDLGVNVRAEKLVEAARENGAKAICLSALLTTTMLAMEQAVMVIRASLPEIKVLVGGAPLTQEFATKIQADFYSQSPQAAIEYLELTAL